jgi:regulator of ribosome biosynthesis
MSLDLGNTLCSYDRQNRCVVDINTFLYEGEKECVESIKLSVLDMFRHHAASSTEAPSTSTYTPKTLCFPRSKAIPKEKQKTRWEKFAAKKGIVKSKKSHHTYNEARKEWVPRFGGRSSEIKKEEDWCVELN